MNDQHPNAGLAGTIECVADSFGIVYVAMATAEGPIVAKEMMDGVAYVVSRPRPW